MKEKLPKVFANRVENLNNNRKYYYSEKNQDIPVAKKASLSEKTDVNKYNLEKLVHESDIKKKIIDLFKSPNNVYKVTVNIKMNGKTVTKNIIGRTNSTLITLDNETIPIKDIEDITENN